MMKILKNTSEKYFSQYIIYICFILNFIVDLATGFLLLNKIPVSLSIPFKLFILLLVIYSIGAKNPNYLIFPLALFSLSCISIFASLYMEGGKNPLTQSNILKIIYSPIIYVYLLLFYKNDRTIQAENVIQLNTLVFVLNIVLGIMGIGYSSYGTDAGIKGFFYDANALSGTVLVLYVYSYIASNKKSIVFVVWFFIAFLIGTKSGILAIFLYYTFSKLYYSKWKTKVFIVILVFLFCYWIYIFYTKIPLLVMHVDRIIYSMEHNGNILNALTGNRIMRIDNVLNKIKNTETIMNYLFGYGYIDNCEMDFFDTLFAYGIIMCVLITGFYLYLIWKNRKNVDILLLDVLFLIISFIAGHIWWNTSISFFFCFINIKKIRVVQKETKKRKIMDYICRSTYDR